MEEWRQAGRDGDSTQPALPAPTHHPGTHRDFCPFPWPHRRLRRGEDESEFQKQ